MGARCVRILVRLFANSLGMIAILALADKDFDATELTAFFAFCVWLVLVEGAVALAHVEPSGSKRGHVHVGALSTVAVIALALTSHKPPQTTFEFSSSYYASLSSIR